MFVGVNFMDKNSITYSVSCPVCFKYPSECELSKCSACKYVFYCSKEHQKKHWPEHKLICKFIQTIKTTDELSRFEEAFFLPPVIRWLTLINVYELSIGKKLTIKEKISMLWMYKCKLCSNMLKDGLNVFCSDCNGVVYCSELHKEKDRKHHSTMCKDFKLSLDVEKAIKDQVYLSVMVNDIDKLRSPLCLKDMDQLLEMSDINVTPITMERFGKGLATRELSNAFTVLYMIQRCASLKKMNNRELAIHIIGPWNSEKIVQKVLCNFLLHLKVMHIAIIGLGVGGESKESNIIVRDKAPNENVMCISHLNRWKCDYKDYIILNPHSIPDLVLYTSSIVTDVFSDPSEIDMKKKEFLELFTLFPKTIFGFTSEHKNLENLSFFKKNNKKNKIVSVARSEVNPFKSQLPTLNGECHNEKVVYDNHYITILHT